MSNLCTRCGKERIIIKEWTEEIASERRIGKIYHTLTSCPDPECQKKVDQTLALEKQKNEVRQAERIEKEKVQKEERQKRMDLVLSKSNKRK